MRIATTSKEAPQCFDGLNAFIKAAKNGSIPKDIASKYPLFDVKNAKQHLTRDEKKIIQGYQKHPMYRCFQKITAELSKPYIAQIAPYYIAHWFIHKQDPKNPFKKQKYELNPSNTSVNDNLTVTEDERVFYYQDCHYALYKRLSQYVEERHPEWLTDRNLSDAFYVRCRSLAVKSGWLPMESRPIYKRWMPDDLMYQLYQKLDGLFDYTRFPTYANTFCRPEDMFYFLYEKQDTKIVRVKKIIKKLISESDAVNEYMEKAFLSENGIGRSVMPLKWHEELAEWLEKIIRRDDTVQAYVRGNPDPCLPGSNVKLSECREVWRPANEWTPEERQEVLQGALLGTVVDTHIDQQIYSEDLQPYLSVVEWYIQKVCYETIAEDMRPKIFGLYKKLSSI